MLRSKTLSARNRQQLAVDEFRLDADSAVPELTQTKEICSFTPVLCSSFPG
jgi:hypothetical protein